MPMLVACDIIGPCLDGGIHHGVGITGLAVEFDGADMIEHEGDCAGFGGVAVIIEALTDNRNRTASEIRSYFTKAGGSLAETGAVSFMFDHVGAIEFDTKATDADTMMAGPCAWSMAFDPSTSATSRIEASIPSSRSDVTAYSLMPHGTMCSRM